MASAAKYLIAAGLLLLAAGGLLWLAARLHLPLGRLPGDIVYQRKGLTIYFPWVTLLIVSLVLSVLARWFTRR